MEAGKGLADLSWYRWSGKNSATTNEEGQINRPVQQLHLLEEHKETVRVGQNRTVTDDVTQSTKQQE